MHICLPFTHLLIYILGQHALDSKVDWPNDCKSGHEVLRRASRQELRRHTVSCFASF